MDYIDCNDQYLFQDSTFSDFSLILMQETPILIAHGFTEIISSSQSIKLRKVIQAFQKYIGSHMYSTHVTDVFKRFLEFHFSQSYSQDKKPDLNKKYVCDAIKVIVITFFFFFTILLEFIFLLFLSDFISPILDRSY